MTKVGSDALGSAGRVFLEEYLAKGGPSLSKRDIDLLILHSLEQEGVVEADASDFDVARLLRVTPARARNLRRDARIRWGDAQAGLNLEQFRAVSRSIDASSFTAASPYVRLRCREPYLAHLVESELTDLGLPPDYERNRSVLRLHVAALFLLARHLDEETDDVVAAIKTAMDAVDSPALRKLTREPTLKRALARVRAAGDLAKAGTSIGGVINDVMKVVT